MKKRKRITEAQIREFLGDIVTGQHQDFLVTQVLQAQKDKRGRRWSARDKSIALSLLHASPKAYRILGKIIHLPHEKTLRKEVQKLEVSRAEKILHGLVIIGSCKLDSSNYLVLIKCDTPLCSLTKVTPIYIFNSTLLHQYSTDA